MRKYRRIISSLLAFVFLFTSIFAGTGIQAFALDTYASSKGRDKLEILVKYKDDSQSATTETKLKKRLKMGKLKLAHKMKRSKIEVLEIGNTDNLNKTIAELEKDPNVLFAQPNYLLSVEEDPRYNEQWALKNYGQQVGYVSGTDGVDLNVEDAWGITTGAPTVVVGVLDTGIDINHKDLKKNIYQNTAEVAGNGIDDDGNGYIDDVNGWDFANGDNTVYDGGAGEKHGTGVAGIIGAESNSEGIKGIAPNVKILPLKFVSNGQGYTSDAIEAFEYAQKMGCKVINCSFGSKEDNPALKEAMEKSDVLFVCAAGNDGQDNSVITTYPAGYSLPNVISVAAVDNKGALAEFSNYGENVDIAAPGVGILTTSPEGGYEFMSGTSFAAPFVSGIAALVRSHIPDMTPSQLKTRIKSNITEEEDLNGQVAVSGIPDAYGALTDPTATTGPATTVTTTTGTGTGKAGKTGAVKTLAVAVSPQIMEQIHYGETGVSATTGNYCKTVTDFSMNTPGFRLDISRTYNSKDDRTSSSMGRGWTFGFEGSVKQDTANTAIWVVRLPNGSAQAFQKDANGAFIANDSRSTLTKKADNTYLLTTKDQYTYKFTPEGYLTEMADPSGNKITIAVNGSGKAVKITDQVGRSFNINYNEKGLITRLVSPISGVEVNYAYDGNNLLTSVTDPTKSVDTYAYDGSNCLTTIKDHGNNVVETIAYDHNAGANQHKVTQYTDEIGCVSAYTYDATNRVTTINTADKSGGNARSYVKKYDTSMYVTEATDPEGKISKIEYFLDANSVNIYGEEKSTTDRDGNKTIYDRDDRGNVLKKTNPDGTTHEYKYDGKNNVLSEKDESNNWTYYTYDANGVKLLKRAEPLNGSDAYSDGADQSKFAITRYEYYTQEEALAMGCKALNLLRREISPSGESKTYTYDAFGNVATIIDAENNTTQNTYNDLGWLLSTVTPEGKRTDFIYDNQGRLLEKSLNGGETTRIAYDSEGRKIKEVSANQYQASKDTISGTIEENYSEDVGFRYTYYTSGSYGRLKAVKDPEGNSTSYVYDIYGNVTQETKPNGSIYLYAYDKLDRVIRAFFQNNASDKVQKLADYGYESLADGKTRKTIKRCLTSDEDIALTAVTYDYAGREVEQLNPDSGKIQTKYNGDGTVNCKIDANGAATYFRYDGLGRLTETWRQVSSSGYSYTQTIYDKSGKKLKERYGKDLIELHGSVEGDRAVTKTYTYFTTGWLKSVADSSGALTTYEYDKDGNVIRQNEYTSKDESNITEFEYNYFGKPSKKTTYVRNGDLAGKGWEDHEKTGIVTTFGYDKNGNLVKVTTPDGNRTITTYDNLDRPISNSTQALDEKGLPTIITAKKTYDSMGNVKSETDALNNETTYTYSPQGFLTRKADKLVTKAAANGADIITNVITAFDYDRAGRKVREVSPKNFNEASANDLSTMNRTEYTYDKMDHMLTKTEVYKANPGDAAFTSFVSKAFKYDLAGNMIKELDGEGYKVGFGETATDRINSGYGTTYQYNLAGQVVLVLDPDTRERELPYTKKYDYDGLLRKTAETNGKGAMVCYYYDDADHITSVTVRDSVGDPERVVKSTTYDLSGNPVTQTDGNGNVTMLEYNAFDKVRKVTYPGDESVRAGWKTSQYDAMGNALLVESSEGTINTFTYDKQGRVLTHSEQGKDTPNTAITISTAYDKLGNKRFQTDGNGNTTENLYDTLGRIVETRQTVSNTKGEKVTHNTKQEYDKDGKQIRTIDWRGNVTELVYDSLGRVIEKRDASYAATKKPVQTLTYNASHVQVKSVDGKGNATLFSYDRNNRLIQTTDPEGHITGQGYDDAGNLNMKSDGRGNKTYYEYDSLNRLACVTNALKEETKYTYDMNGNTLTQTDGNGNVITMEYNALNKLSRRIDMGGKTGADGKYTYEAEKTESYTYDSEGDLLTKRDRNGIVTSYSYDIHSRMTLQDAGGEKISYTYDNNGNQLSMTDSTGTTNRTYDELNRVTGKSITRLGTTTFQYDLAFNGADGYEDGYVGEKATDPKGNTTLKIYDKVGRLKVVKADGETSGTSYQYDENGNRVATAYDSGARAEYSFNKDNLLISLTNKKPGGAVLDTYSYQYDTAHNQTQKTDPKGTTQYQYDSLNRLNYVLEPASLAGKLTQYTYDHAGNRLTETVTETDGATQKQKSTVTKYNYNEQNRLMTTEVTNEAGAKSVTKYVYDANGNLTAKSMETTKPYDPNTKPSFGMFIIGQDTSNLRPEIQAIAKSTAMYEYDHFNQLAVAKTSGGTSVYKYNGDGFRVEKEVNGTTTKYLYEYDKVVLELDGNGKEIGRNIYGTNLISKEVDGQKLSYMYNGHADVTSLIDGTGAVKNTYYYDAFGNVKEETGTAKNNITYAGYQYDKETGLYYLNSRMYDPVTARFMQEDTYRGQANDPLSLNLYTYCHNEPIAYADPSGHTRKSDSGMAMYKEDRANRNAKNQESSGSSSGRDSAKDNGREKKDSREPNVSITTDSQGRTVYTFDSSYNGMATGIGYTPGEVIVHVPNGTVLESFGTSGSNVTFVNDGVVGRIGTPGGSQNTTILNGGKIGNVDFGAGTNSTVVNDGTITRIITGSNSQNSVINNYKVGTLVLGEKATCNIEDYGRIGSISDSNTPSGGKQTMADRPLGRSLTPKEYTVTQMSYTYEKPTFYQGVQTPWCRDENFKKTVNLLKYDLKNVNMQIYTDSKAYHFSDDPFKMATGQPDKFLVFGETKEYKTVNDMLSLNQAKAKEELWREAKVAISAASDLNVFYKGATATIPASLTLSEIGKTGWNVAGPDVRILAGVEAGNLWIEHKTSDIGSLSKAGKYLSDLIPIYGTADMYLNFYNGDPIGAFVPLNK